jgi:hypothetical protein
MTGFDSKREAALDKLVQVTEELGLYDKPAQESMQVSPLEFVTMVLEKEHLIGNPIIWAQWPNKEKST